MPEASFLEWFSAYAYQPHLVYAAVIFMMFASSFGLPIPEEATLVSVGLLAFLATQTDTYPPPYPGAQPINVYTLAAVCFVAVFLSDLVVYSIGRFGGVRVKNSRRLNRFLPPGAMLKAEMWVKKHGALMAGVFRFTPGLRFPGHMTCGMLGLPLWKFSLVDGIAALISVPTQILLIAYYGEVILYYLKRFREAVFLLLFLAVAFYLFKRIWRWRQRRAGVSRV